jgi:hypothetical protein
MNLAGYCPNFRGFLSQFARRLRAVMTGSAENSGTPQNGRSPLIVTRRPERTWG